MGPLCSCVALIALVLGASGCGHPAAPDTPVPVPVTRFVTEAHSFTAFSALTARQHLVVRDAHAWAATWEAIWRNRAPVPERLQIDFAHEMLIVVSLGSRPTSGYDILIDSAAETSDGLIVTVRAIAPAAGCGILPVVTQPVDIARLPRSPRPVRFEERVETRACA